MNLAHGEAAVEVVEGVREETMCHKARLKFINLRPGSSCVACSALY